MKHVLKQMQYRFAVIYGTLSNKMKTFFIRRDERTKTHELVFLDTSLDMFVKGFLLPPNLTFKWVTYSR